MAKYNAEEFRSWGVSRKVSGTDSLDCRYVLARPENYKFDGWRYRLKLAYLVLTGKCDGIEWADGQ